MATVPDHTQHDPHAGMDVVTMLKIDHEREKLREVEQERDCLRALVADMIWQFGRWPTYHKNKRITGGLTVMEEAFLRLGLSNPCTKADLDCVRKGET